MMRTIFLLVVLVACGLGGCTYTRAWGADEVILLQNGVEGTVMTNLTVSGVPPDYGGAPNYVPTIATGQEVQVPIRYVAVGNYVELKLNVFDTKGKHLGIAREVIYIDRPYGYSTLARSESPRMWYITTYEPFVSLERARR